MSGFSCQECGRRFRTVGAARKASFDGCPGCGGCDIDLDVATVSVAPAPLRLVPSTRCVTHPAYEASYCPGCGTTPRMPWESR